MLKTVFFSPTGNSQKIVMEMAHALGEDIQTYDITENKLDTEVLFERDDFVIFGAPVYYGRLPHVFVERMKKFKGNDTPCIISVSFGNRAFDDALAEFVSLAQKQGFVIKGALAVVGRHTYGNIQVNRPDEQDLRQVRDFALKVQKTSHTLEISDIPGKVPEEENLGVGQFHPLTSDVCVKCGLCVRKCPVQAIETDCKTVNDACLSCFRCIRICPVGAKNMNVDAYLNFAKEFSEKLKNRKENQFFVK